MGAILKGRSVVELARSQAASETLAPGAFRLSIGSSLNGGKGGGFWAPAPPVWWCAMWGRRSRRQPGVDVQAQPACQKRQRPGAGESRDLHTEFGVPICYPVLKRLLAKTTEMRVSNDFERTPPVSQAARRDLCAQIVPLDRYGLPGLSAALVDGLRMLFGATRRGRDAEGDCVSC
jgi:hypothetical protein